MNSAMAQLLRQTNTGRLHEESNGSRHPRGRALILVEGSVLLKDEFERAKGVKAEKFPDRTGFECFVNHVHLPYDGSRESLEACLEYAKDLKASLDNSVYKACFLVVLSLSSDDCVIRFHQRRSNESWIAEDLEQYPDEAILVFEAGARGEEDSR